MDMWTAKTRSQVMAKVRSRGNLSTEEALAKAFRWLGVTGWRRHLPEKIGNRSVRPDFVFCKARLVMFVHGCFWHGCPEHHTIAKRNADFWAAKVAGKSVLLAAIASTRPLPAVPRPTSGCGFCLAFAAGSSTTAVRPSGSGSGLPGSFMPSSISCMPASGSESSPAAGFTASAAGSPPPAIQTSVPPPAT